LYAAIYDERFAPSLAFAREARSLGCSVRGLDRGDVTRLWYHDLYHRWRQGPAAIGGLTSPDALFVLETFGNDAGLRLRFRAEHRIAADRVEHRLRGPAELVGQAALGPAGEHWGARIAHLVARCPGARVTPIERDSVSMHAARAALAPQLLVSWVLAPARSPS
jgi:hypothetical protein